jgi:hypothetical protein
MICDIMLMMYAYNDPYAHDNSARNPEQNLLLPLHCIQIAFSCEQLSSNRATELEQSVMFLPNSSQLTLPSTTDSRFLSNQLLKSTM